MATLSRGLTLLKIMQFSSEQSTLLESMHVHFNDREAHTHFDGGCLLSGGRSKGDL
jgi:hypothetical protein